MTWSGPPPNVEFSTLFLTDSLRPMQMEVSSSPQGNVSIKNICRLIQRRFCFYTENVVLQGVPKYWTHFVFRHHQNSKILAWDLVFYGFTNKALKYESHAMTSTYLWKQDIAQGRKYNSGRGWHKSKNDLSSMGVLNIGIPFVGYLTSKKWVFKEELNKLMLDLQQVKMIPDWEQQHFINFPLRLD